MDDKQFKKFILFFRIYEMLLSIEYKNYYYIQNNILQ